MAQVELPERAVQVVERHRGDLAHGVVAHFKTPDACQVRYIRLRDETAQLLMAGHTHAWERRLLHHLKTPAISVRPEKKESGPMSSDMLILWLFL